MTGLDRLCRYQLAWGIVGIVAGLFGLFHSRSLAFTASHGAETGLAHYELHWMTYNRLGALVALVFAATGLVSGAIRRPEFGWIAAAGFALVSLQTLVQWRTGQASNVFGSTGPTLGFSLAMILVYTVTTSLATTLARADDNVH